MTRSLAVVEAAVSAAADFTEAACALVASTAAACGAGPFTLGVFMADAAIAWQEALDRHIPSLVARGVR